MQCYTELTPPTAVTHSLSLPFLSATANNLLVAKTSLLQIFSFKQVIEVNQVTTQSDGDTPFLPVSGAFVRSEKMPTTKLVLVAQYELSGTIISLARVKISNSKSGGEAVLVALRDAKLSLVEWDPERYSISTISIHYYEREDLQGSPWEPDIGQCVNYLTVDPRSRCAAFKFGVRHLAILPFHQAGDDLVIDDYDPAIDDDRSKLSKSLSLPTNGDALPTETPYAASFVLSLLALDPNLTHPLHLAFLYEYREPTFGVLSSQSASSSALLHDRRDTLSYSVFTLDLEQRASTTLLSVNNLPYDLYQVVPLQLPVGGAVLVGTNELIHVDQAGKTNGVALNDFAKNSTSFAMSDQSDLAMRLEGCFLEQLRLDSGEMLMILNSGELAILGFKIDGRSVSGLSVRRIAEENGGFVVQNGASCVSTIGRGRMFIGSELADSVVIGWSRRYTKLKRQRSRANLDMDGEEDASDIDEDDIEDDEDDLYSSAKTNPTLEEASTFPSSEIVNEEYGFRIHDSIQNLAPLTDVALGRQNYGSLEEENSARGLSSSGLELIAATGCGRAGGLTTIRREICPQLAGRYDIPDAQGIWAICARSLSKDASSESASDNKSGHDRFIIASRVTQKGEEQSVAYSINSTGLEEIKDGDFDPTAGATIDVGVLNGGTRIVQVLRGELRTYDGGFGLAQIFPMTDEVTEAEPKVVSASFTDHFVLLIRDDSSVMVLRADEGGDLDEVERGDDLLTTEWVSGSLYEDSNDVLRLESDEDSEDDGNVLIFLLSATGSLQIYRLPDLRQPVYVADGLSFLPPFLSTEFTVRRSAARDTLTEILVAELGDSIHKSPYVILRSANDDLTIYQPYQSPVEGKRKTSLRFLKISNPHQPKTQIETSDYGTPVQRDQPLRVMHDLCDYSTVFIPGASPGFILKPRSSPPRVISIQVAAVKGISSLHTPSCERGFAYVDSEGSVRVAQLPPGRDYSTGWVTHKSCLGEEVQALDCHDKTGFCVIGMSRKVDFKLPEDEFHYEWSLEETLFLPQVDQGSIKLLDRATMSIIDSHDLDPSEIVTSIKSLSLEVSEHTHTRHILVAIGTAVLRGEDLPSHGRIYIYDIIPVVPEPSQPQTGHKLKLIAKEEVKGAVTAISAIGTQGFLLATQGQKCMVRGLKEDGTLLPVAFMDMQCYVSVAKELPGTGLCLMGDAIKGIWFAGYTEDPYQLRLFGKSSQHLEVLAADFLPDGTALYLVVADADCNIHIFQFDPEHPKSLSGQRLLQISTFHTGQPPTTTLLLSPSPTKTTTTQTSPQTLLLPSRTGSLSSLCPLPPHHHRTLAALTSYLQTTLPHPLGLNPRAYRAVEIDSSVGGRAVVDGNVVRRWGELGSWKRGEGEGRVGGAGEVRGVLGGLWGGGPGVGGL